MKRNLMNVLLIAMITLFIQGPAESTVPDQISCLKCHDKAYKMALQYNFIHRSFLDKKCLVCHVEEVVSSSENSEKKRLTSKKPEIKWLQKHYDPALSHFFLVPANKVDDTLFVQIRGENGSSSITSLTLPALEKLPQLKNDGKKPTIIDQKFLGVTRGILYSATISWETDKPSDAQIHYGIGSFNLKTRIDYQFKTRHTIDISPLKSNKTYNYILISKDIHGNRVISEPMTFTTGKLKLSKPADPENREKPAASRKKLIHRIYAVGEKYFISITADQPTYMSIGSHRDLQSPVKIPAVAGGREKPAKHARLKNSFDTNIGSCLGCHQDYKNEANHPINVRPKRGMSFPDDYPLLDNGRMHCMTCHEPHSANNEARLRRSSKKALCTGCHKDYG